MPVVRRTQPYAKKIAHKGIWSSRSSSRKSSTAQKSAEGKVRHPFFKGSREDIDHEL